jgi:6-phosphofructokinase 1
MAAAVATGADAVLFRESGRSEEELVAQVVRVIESAFGRRPPKPRVLILKSEGVKASLESLKARADETLAAKGLAIETRVTVLGHVVRGGAPSAQDRLMSGRLARAAVWAAIEGHTSVMIGWQRSALAPAQGAPSAHDPYCALVPIDAVLAETQAILDGTSPVAKWRTRALSEVEELLNF